MLAVTSHPLPAKELNRFQDPPTDFRMILSDQIRKGGKGKGERVKEVKRRE